MAGDVRSCPTSTASIQIYDISERPKVSYLSMSSQAWVDGQNESGRADRWNGQAFCSKGQGGVKNATMKGFLSACDSTLSFFACVMSVQGSGKRNLCLLFARGQGSTKHALSILLHYATISQAFQEAESKVESRHSLELTLRDETQTPAHSRMLR